MKKIISVAVLAILILVAGAYVYRSKINDKEKKSNADTVRIGYNAESINNASMIIAYEKEYFQNHGISPQLVPLKSGKEVAQAMAANQIDVSLGGLTAFMPIMAKGAPIKFITTSSVSPTYVFVRPNGNINKLSDLYGKTVSATSKGINELIFKAALDKEHIDAGKIKMADIEKAYNVAALMDKKAIDAAVVSEQDTIAFIKAGAVLLPEWESKGYNKEDSPRNSIIINSDFISQHEDVVGRFMDACIDSHRLIKNNPDEAAEALVKHIKNASGGAVSYSSEEIVKKWANKEVENMIWQDPEMTMGLAKKAKEVGIVEKELSLEQVYDLRFENKLKAAQNEIYGEQN